MGVGGSLLLAHDFYGVVVVGRETGDVSAGCGVRLNPNSLLTWDWTRTHLEVVMSPSIFFNQIFYRHFTAIVT